MLVLTRKVGECIWIGDVKVMIVLASGDKIRLGVEAPKEVPVHRGEIYDAIQAKRTSESES